MDLCADSKSNCVIYTGRLLGSDNASATEVFEMVKGWLAIQNGSLMNGTLSVDPNCTLRHFSPSDTNPSNKDDVPIEENESGGVKQKVIESIEMLAVGFGSGFGIIICVVLICVCGFKLRKRTKPNTVTYSENETRLTPFLQTSDDAQRHYSIVLERNPSYNRYYNNAIKPFYKVSGMQMEAGSSDSLTSENPYSYTSLKTVQRQADALVIKQQGEEIAHLTVEQPQRLVSEGSNNEYVVESLTSSGYYINDDNVSTFHPSTPNSQEAYLSIS